MNNGSRHILFVAELCALDGAGPSAVNGFCFAKALAEAANYQVTLVTSSNVCPASGIHFHHVPKWVFPFKVAKYIEDSLLARFTQHPRPGSWAVRARMRCRKLLKQEQFDGILAWSNPIGSLFAAIGDRPNRVPLIWRTGDPYPASMYPRYRLDGEWRSMASPSCPAALQWLQGNSGSIDAIVSPSELQNEWYGSKAVLEGPAYSVLPHIGGWDKPPQHPWPVSRSATPLSLAYFGRLSASRCPEAVLGALDQVNSAGDVAHLHFYGPVHDRWKSPLDTYQQRGQVTMHGTVGFRESLAKMVEHDALLLLEAEFEKGIFTPSKLADYAWSGRPVIAVSPEGGAVRSWMGQAHPGFVGFSMEALEGALRDLTHRKERGECAQNYAVPFTSFSPAEATDAFSQTLDHQIAGIEAR